MGHVRSYSIGDAYARFSPAREGMRWRCSPSASTPSASRPRLRQRSQAWRVAERLGQPLCLGHDLDAGQLERLGFLLRPGTAPSSAPTRSAWYRWSQWLFLTLLEAGLIYRGTGTVDWCETCQTTLATIQVENGLCWRCHNPVQLLQRTQWYLRISAHVPENDLRLQELADSGIWDENSLASQRFVLGRLDGVELDLRAPDGAEPDGLHAPPRRAGRGALRRDLAQAPSRSSAGSPTPPCSSSWRSCAPAASSATPGNAEEIPLIDTGRTLPSPTTGEPLPVLISPVVDGRFGATAVLGIPARDHTDALIAGRLSLQIDHAASGEDVGRGRWEQRG